MHSCGDIRIFVPELIEIGIDMLNPLEVKAGMDPVALKRQYGRLMGFHGGINCISEYLQRVCTTGKKTGFIQLKF